MTTSRSVRASLAWLLAGGGLVATGLVVVTSIAYRSDASIDDAVGALPLVGSIIAFLLSGAIVASRQPGNIIGWVLMIPGLTIPIAQLANDWLARLDPPPTSATPILWMLLWFCSWSWILLIFPIFHLLLTFPSGRLLSPRWRLAVALEVVMVGSFVALAGLMVELGVLVNDETLWSIPNPIGFLGWDVFDRFVSRPWEVGLLTLTILSVSAVILRYRHGSPEARQQLKWPLAAVALFGVVYGLGSLTSDNLGGSIVSVLFPLSIAFIPISVAIAILRYRLYEIDRIISRTISYALVTVTMFAVFAVVNLAAQGLLAMFVRGNTAAVAISTLVVAALFNPLRTRLQRVIDGRFNRRRVDQEQTIAAFAAGLRQDMDVDRLGEHVRATVARALEPEVVALWRRPIERTQ